MPNHDDTSPVFVFKVDGPKASPPTEMGQCFVCLQQRFCYLFMQLTTRKLLACVVCQERLNHVLHQSGED
jgi:hypothetical protein